MPQKRDDRTPIRLNRKKEDESWKEDWRAGGKGKKKAEQVKGSFRTKSFRVGSYTTAVCVVALVLAVFVNLAVAALPSKFTKHDISSNQIYSISEQSEQIAKAIDEEVTVYLIAQSGNQDETLLELLGRYQSANSKIQVVQKDPVVNPSFTAEYTSDTVVENSLIVVCGDRFRYIPNSSIYVVSYTMDANYQYSATTDFDGENQITSAIDYVTSDDLPVVYYLSGHGELTLPTYLQTDIGNENIELKELNLLSNGGVPEDCTCLMVYSPSGDISEQEKEWILSYLKEGGRMAAVTDYVETEFPNLAEVYAEYGLSVEPGLVLEQDSRYCYMYQTILLPDIESHAITAPLRGYTVIIPYAQGITMSDDLRDGLAVESLLSTSDDAFSKLDMESDSVEKAEEDIDGPFALAAAVTDTHDAAGENDTKIVVFTSSYLLQEEFNQLVSGMNENLFLNAVEWLCERENTISIRAKSLDTGMLLVDSASSSMWNILLIGVLPLSAIIGGAVYLYRRKKR